MEKPRVALLNARLVEQPWFGRTILCGEAYGHPSFPNGSEIWTSKVTNLTPGYGIAPGVVVETLNTDYVVGSVAV